MDRLFDMEFERTEFSDENYGIVGRALAFAQKFEGDCKALRLLIQAKTGELDSSLFDDEVAFNKFVSDLHRESLSEQISQISKVVHEAIERLGLQSSVDETLQLARKDRNKIAHEVCLGIQWDIESDQGRKRLVDEVSDCIRRIAKANLVVLVISALLTHDDFPRRDYLDAYCDRVLEWVCSTEG
ncbi:MAG: hypothetical protein WD904_08720 [Dehalococcoidia bacterium]